METLVGQMHKALCDNLPASNVNDYNYAEDLSNTYNETQFCDDYNIIEPIWSTVVY